MQIPNNQIFTLQFNVIDVNKILNGLAELPFKESNHVINSIHTQMAGQITPVELPKEDGVSSLPKNQNEKSK